MKYTADLGSWERGRVVRITATNPREALVSFQKLCKGEEEVVQIHEDEESHRCVYDYMNFFSIYE